MVVCGYQMEQSQSRTSIAAYARQQVMWMHHTQGLRFRSGTIGYDYDTLPNKSPTTIRYPKLRGRGEFQKRRGKGLYKWFGSPLFLKNIVPNPLFCNLVKKKDTTLGVLKSTQRCLKQVVPLFAFWKLKSKVLIFGQTRSNPQKRF